MPSNFAKKQSKRMKARLRYKITKKVKEHKRKIKKEAKKNPIKHRKKKKDIGIPNSLPFKETVLKQAVEWREQMRVAKEEKRQAEREQLVNKARNLPEISAKVKQNPQEVVYRPQGLSEVYKILADREYKEPKRSVENSLKCYYKEFKKVIDQADVILEVLDARDPLGTRCKEVEEAVISSGLNKKIVLVLNKIDLVPRVNIEAWLKYLKNEFPTVPFKSSVQKQKSKLGHVKKYSMWKGLENKTSNCLGADLLMKLLANYCRSEGLKVAIRVGVVGLPNTGKSSIINSLKRNRACRVGDVPGITKSMQVISLTKNIKLLDSPGVVMSDNPSGTSLILKNCVKVSEIDDPSTAVETILKRCNKEQIMIHYKIPKYNDTMEFLAILARKWGYFKKGGSPDINKSAKVILQHWNSGRISYYTEPPENVTAHVSAEIVSEMGKSFDLDAIKDEEIQILNHSKPMSSSFIPVPGSQPVTCVMDKKVAKSIARQQLLGIEESNEEEVESMDENEAPEATELQNTKICLSGSQATSTTSLASSTSSSQSRKNKDGPHVEQKNKSRKEDFKKMKKLRKKSEKLASNLSDTMDSLLTFDTEENNGDAECMDSGSDYEFDKHF
ncbi:guanine nucleotide-binding protein-like 3 homolog [Octopus bimaculoides]|uniref:CP-type G domain-containing protein n=1 Tax=Octopus bimaculoides TaxID=37653 RepID=A0A0L8FU24_OCTBM|nr:guanine nucleotide-binding protein-like 3 homolog [Octopus bimaculoides]|eukprot:XP_014786894.1 PREDICTED: guanine nucleotide-binding protein-like 3 homolog [Octopus bimaculoides]